MTAEDVEPGSGRWSHRTPRDRRDVTGDANAGAKEGGGVALHPTPELRVGVAVRVRGPGRTPH